ncbi:MAG: hypothetical protein JO041_15395 [Acidobacteria bacterium]|nr:hypothetical protein [Acidobacteriota bacterium]
MPPASSGTTLWLKILLALLAAGLLATGVLVYNLKQELKAVEARQAATEQASAELRTQIGGTAADLKASTAALASQVGMTQKQLVQRAAGLRREQQAAEERITTEQKQQISAVSGEVAGVKAEVGTVRSEADTTRTDLDTTRAKLERTIGDLNLQSGLIAHTRDDLDVLKHKGDRNYYEFTLARNNKKPTPVGTISLQLRKADPKHGKFTLDVISDDKTIAKKDKNLYEPLQFYSGKDRNLFEIVVFSMEKDKISGYLSTPKSAPAPIETGKTPGVD